MQDQKIRAALRKGSQRFSLSLWVLGLSVQGVRELIGWGPHCVSEAWSRWRDVFRLVAARNAVSRRPDMVLREQYRTGLRFEPDILEYWAWSMRNSWEV
eukprot:575284-Rhodomonas_salina.1